MRKLQKMLLLTDGGYKDLKKAALACTLTNFSMILPFWALMQFVIELVKPLMGGEISLAKMWLLFGAAAVGAFLVYLCQRNDYEKTYVVSYTQCERTRVAVAEHIRRLPMSVFNSKDLSELTTNVMGDVATSEHVMSHIIPELAANVISITAICVMLSIYDWRLALAIFVTVPLALGIIMLSRKIYGGVSKKHAAAKLAASERVQEYIEGIKVIRACNMDGERFGALESALREMMRLAMAMEVGTGIFVTGAQAVLQGGIGLTALVGATLLTGGQLGFVPLLTFLMVVVKIYGPVISILTLLPELFYFQIGLRRMRDLLAIEPMTGNEEQKLTDFTVVCDNIGFSYGASGSAGAGAGSDAGVGAGASIGAGAGAGASIGAGADVGTGASVGAGIGINAGTGADAGTGTYTDTGAGAEPAVSGLSATIPAGSLTALVGPSGSGKSTVSRLIARFWDVNRGRITIGGVDVKTLDPEHLMSYMSFVFQDVTLFNDTILGNIRIGNMDATDEQALAAARAARCDDFVSRLPDGYGTMLGENGQTLSGGERQRLSIARALLKDAPIVLLDEATASLDPENEASIQEAISALVADKTVLVIAHRLRTVAGADQIIVLDRGRMAEQGSHDELMARDGLYKRLWTLQTESLGWAVGERGGAA